MGVSANEKTASQGDRQRQLAHDAIQSGRQQLGDGQFVAFVDRDLDRVSVYSVFAEEGTETQKTQHLEHEFSEPTEAIESFFK